jgi:ubiquinone/menaquinone biosynthesis C-methylase UbiE
MEHIAEPVAALAEVRRVLKPGGVIGVRSSTHIAGLQWPDPDLIRTQMAIFARQKATGGANWGIAPSLRAHLRSAGFSRVVGSASEESGGTPAETRLLAEEAFRAATQSDTIADALARGFTDPAEVAQFGDRWRAWGDDPDAFYTVNRCEAIGWVA